MARRKKQVKQPEHSPYLNGHLPKVLAAALTLTAGGGTALSYNTGKGADERVKAAEVKIERSEKDIAQIIDKADKVDRRTIRMQEAIKNIADKVGAKQPKKPYGPDEQ